MIRGLGAITALTYSQTLNGYGAKGAGGQTLASHGFLVEPSREYMMLSGPFLVSRTGDAG